jgi:cell division septation protein DedD
MKTFILFISTAILSIALLQACGPSEEELQQQEQARQDSLEQVYEAQLEQMRRDSIEQARRDSIAEAQEQQRIEYSDDGQYSVQIEAWRSRAKAESQAQEWRNRGYDRAYVVEYGNSETGDVWFRVRLGRFDTEEMAMRLQEELSTEYDTQSWISEPGDPVEQEAMSED